MEDADGFERATDLQAAESEEATATVEISEQDALDRAAVARAAAEKAELEQAAVARAAAEKAELERRKAEAAAILRGSARSRRKRSSPNHSGRSPSPVPRSTRSKAMRKRRPVPGRSATDPPSRASSNRSGRTDDDDAAANILDPEEAVAAVMSFGSGYASALSSAWTHAVASATYGPEHKDAVAILQTYFRKRAARRRWVAFGEYYWTFVYDVQRDRAAAQLQRRMRTRWAVDQTRRECAALRDWDDLVKELQATREARMHAAAVLQGRRRQQTRERRAREWRRKELRKRSSLIWKKTQHYNNVIQANQSRAKFNPFSSSYVGATEHRRAVEAQVGGKFGKFGAPSDNAARRALAAQVATALNVLRFVDAVNAILRRRLVPIVLPDMDGGCLPAASLYVANKAVETAMEEAEMIRAVCSDADGGDLMTGGSGAVAGDDTLSPDEAGSKGDATSVVGQQSASSLPPVSRSAAHYTHLMEWSGHALQNRFSGAVQYLRSGKRYGLLDFDGEAPQGHLITSQSLGASRAELLTAALRQVHLIVPSLQSSDAPSVSAADAMRRKIRHEFWRQLDDFLAGTFESDVCEVESAAAPAPPVKHEVGQTVANTGVQLRRHQLKGEEPLGEDEKADTCSATTVVEANKDLQRAASMAELELVA